MARGIEIAKNNVVALVDSDVVWSENLLQSCIKAFSDNKIGAVATSTRALHPHKWHQRLMDVLWEIRNNVDFPCLAKFGVASVVSGRTAFYRKEILAKNLPEFQRETFGGILLKSGDDKFFTRAVMESGKNVAYQPAVVFTEVPENFITMIKQFIRWQRNSWRSDIKFITSKTALKRIPLSVFLVDRWLGKFAIIYGTFVAMYSILLPLPSLFLATVFIFWWVVSRTLKSCIGGKGISKMALIYVAWVVFGALCSIFSLITVYDTGWYTRTGWKLK